MDRNQTKSFNKFRSPLLNSTQPNFVKRDRHNLNLTYQHSVQTDETIYTLKRQQALIQQALTQTVTQLEQVLDYLGVIFMTSEGRVQFMSQKSEQLLQQYFYSHTSYSLPESLHHWFKHQILQLSYNGDGLSLCSPFRIEQAGQQLIIRLIPGSVEEHYFLLLEEQKTPSFSVAALELIGLTKREAEVLFWIAKDKSNAGIAKELDCCEGTVRKHLEKLYKKLGVQTRTGAVMVVLEKLGLIKG